MNTQILYLIISLLVGAAGGFLITYLSKKNPKALLNTADTVVDQIKAANDTLGKLLPAPAELIIDKVLQTAQAGVHAAQQLCDSSQLTEDQRKTKAYSTAVNLLKLGGYPVTPEIAQAVKDAIETGVFVMKLAKPGVAAPAVPVVPDTAAVTDQPVAAPAPSPISEPKSIIDTIQSTRDQLGETAKAQAIDGFEQKLAAVVEEASVPKQDQTSS